MRAVEEEEDSGGGGLPPRQRSTVEAIGRRPGGRNTSA